MEVLYVVSELRGQLADFSGKCGGYIVRFIIIIKIRVNRSV